MTERGRDDAVAETKLDGEPSLTLLERPKLPPESARIQYSQNRATEIFQFADEVAHAITVDDAVQAGMELMQALTDLPRPGVDSGEFSSELIRTRIDEIRAERLRGDLTRLEEQIALASDKDLRESSFLWQYAKLRKLRRDTVIADPTEQRRLAKRFDFIEERLFNKSPGIVQ